MNLNRRIISYISFLILLVCVSTFASEIYYEGKISPLRIYHKMQNALYGVDSRKVVVDFWRQTRFFSAKVSTTNLIKNFDDLKVTGRASISSLLPGSDYSSSKWIQYYVIRGLPFHWNSKKQRWEDKSLDISDKRAQEELKYSTITTLFYISRHKKLKDTIKYIGKRKKEGHDCYLISYELDPSMFSSVLVVDITVKVWVDKKTFLPVFQRTEGVMGPVKILKRAKYEDYNKKFDFNTPEFIIQQVKEKKQRLRDKVKKIKDAVAQIRGWDFAVIENVGLKFVKRSKIRDLMKEIMQKEHTQEQINNEGIVLKWLNLLPEELDYKEILINNSDAALIAGLYEPDTQTIYIGDYLEPAFAEITLAHEIVHAFQDKKMDLNKTRDSLEKNKDKLFAFKSFIEGEAIAVELEYLLNKNNESFKELGDITDLIEQKIIKNSSATENNLFYSTYGYGADFIQSWLKDNSWQKIDALYKNHPSSTKEILHPRMYKFKERVGKINKRWLNPRPVEDIKLNSKWASVYSSSLGEHLISSSLNTLVDTKKSRKAALGLEDDKIILYEGQNDSQFITFLSRWDTEEDAFFYFNTFKDWIKKKGYSLQENTKNKKSIWINADGNKINVQHLDSLVLVVWGKEVNDELFSNIVIDIVSQIKRGER